MSDLEIIAGIALIGVAGYAYYRLGPRDESWQGPLIPPIPGFNKLPPLLPKGFLEPKSAEPPAFDPAPASPVGPRRASAPVSLPRPDLGDGRFSAQPLIDLIQRAEAGPRGYDSYYSGVKLVPPRRVTSMTLDEVQDWQQAAVRAGSASVAVGMFQVVSATLASVKSQLGLSGRELFDKNLQDRIGLTLMERRGLKRYRAGTLTMRGFGNLLAREWAGFPVLSDQQGHKRPVTRGQSYYAGFVGNKATISAAQFEAALRRMKG